MTTELKQLTLKLHENFVRYRDTRWHIIKSAEDTVSADLLQVKTAMGLAGLKARFFFPSAGRNDEGASASLDVKETAESEWDNWDELGYAGKDKDGMLAALEMRLRELAPYVEWEKEIAV